MFDSAISIAVLAGISAAGYLIFLKLGSDNFTAPLGAMVIAAGALLSNLMVVLAMRARGQSLVFSAPALKYLILGGIAAAGVDALGLLAYARGLKVSSSFVINATATGLVLLIGVVAFREPVTLIRVLAIAMIGGGMLLLNYQGS